MRQNLREEIEGRKNTELLLSLEAEQLHKQLQKEKEIKQKLEEKVKMMLKWVANLAIIVQIRKPNCTPWRMVKMLRGQWPPTIVCRRLNANITPLTIPVPNFVELAMQIQGTSYSWVAKLDVKDVIMIPFWEHLKA